MSRLAGSIRRYLSDHTFPVDIEYDENIPEYGLSFSLPRSVPSLHYPLFRSALLGASGGKEHDVVVDSRVWGTNMHGQGGWGGGHGIGAVGEL